MRCYRNFSLFCISLAFILNTNQSAAYSQFTNVSFDKVTIKDGLSQSTVNSIIQDKHGFMWFATYGGLNKYDGYSFTVYQNDESDSTSIGNNNSDLYQSWSGHLHFLG